MPPDTRDRPVRLPRIEQIRLHRFSLYEQAPTVEADLPRGVFCLAGANGLGKSTFLSALNYGVTGTVPDPGREFRGVEDYYSKVRSYSESFFRGRISDGNAEAAQVELLMRAGERRYRVVRGMFEARALRHLEVTDIETGEVVVANDPLLPDEDRHELYATMLISDLRLQSFAQLTFLQHFVVTFDERRELLFWGRRTLPAALFIAFGLDPTRAERADFLQEEVRKSDSLARNYSWQASDWSRQLDNLTKAATDVVEEDEGVVRKHRELIAELEELGKEVEDGAKELADAQVRIAGHSAQLRALRTRYDELWATRLQSRSHPSLHPVITASLEHGRCAICGSEEAGVSGVIEAALDATTCPLCDSSVDSKIEPQADLGVLAQLDESIVVEQRSILASEQVSDGLTTRLADARARMDAAAEEIAHYERENDLALLRGRGELDAVAERYRSAMAEQLKRKERQLKRRDEARTELRVLQRELVESYDVARESFVPDFQRLAERFLGLPLDVEFQARRNEVSLILSLHGERRRAEQDLSESQRFFIDIALRMAIIGQLSPDPAEMGSMLLDTPEGSLDIAYEARAGDMLATFVRDGFGLIMTANINTSQLLERLASHCGPGYMTLERMTDWTVLSEVQAAEETLFKNAYSEIETALESGG